MKTNDLTRIAMMTAVLCILAPISVPVGSAAISLSTFVLYLMAYILKPKQNIAAVGIYLGGISRFVSPNGGYLIGYLFTSCIGAWFIQKYPQRTMQMFGLCLGTLPLYLIGTFWLAHTTDITFSAALWSGALLYLPFDIIKMLLASYIGKKLQKHIK